MENGYLGYYGLLAWWKKEFTIVEQTYILKKFKPMGSGELTKGTILGSSVTAINFLTNLQSFFTTLADEAISEKILKKAESIVAHVTPVLDIHFLYSCFIEHYYKKRHLDNRNYQLAKTYCLQQIEISDKAKEAFLSDASYTSLPRHKGFEQLAIILEKEHDYLKALQLSQQAKEMGWRPDWDKRIAKLKNKVNSY